MWICRTARGARIPVAGRAGGSAPERVARASSDHPLLGALIETVLQQGRAESAFAWSTQDYASVIIALAGFARRDPVTAWASVPPTTIRCATASGIDTTISLRSRVCSKMDRRRPRLRSPRCLGGRPDVYFALEVDEVPVAPPVRPDIHGIVVERWYERFDDGSPVTRVNEGDLVRVRLRVTVPADREFVAVEIRFPPASSRRRCLRTSATLDPFATPQSDRARAAGDRDRRTDLAGMAVWTWDDGHWSPWEHKEMHDDRVVYVARFYGRAATRPLRRVSDDSRELRCAAGTPRRCTIQPRRVERAEAGS